MVLDGVGWHRAKALEIPPNVSLLRLPPDGPELNPVETVFQTLKTRSGGEGKGRRGLVGFSEAPARIASVGRRTWARLD